MPYRDTAFSAANTMVRAFLKKIGEEYLGQQFNTIGGTGTASWLRIRDDVFGGKCAYCEELSADLTVEYLIGFNRQDCGLHHPGNTVPSCRSCKKRGYNRNEERRFTWLEQLEHICNEQQRGCTSFEERKTKILKHIEDEGYPKLTPNELSALNALVESLYQRVFEELDRSVELFRILDQSLIGRDHQT